MASGILSADMQPLTLTHTQTQSQPLATTLGDLSLNEKAGKETNQSGQGLTGSLPDGTWLPLVDQNSPKHNIQPEEQKTSENTETSTFLPDTRLKYEVGESPGEIPQPEESSKEAAKALAREQQVIEIKPFTLEEISKHNTPLDMWLVVDNDVYDVTAFQHEHPGGAKSEYIYLLCRPQLIRAYLLVLSGVGGKDATKKFDKYHRRGILAQYKPNLRVGHLDASKTKADPRRSILQKFGIGKGKTKTR
jgi:cytochrome b involved in lipid metabolism